MTWHISLGTGFCKPMHVKSATACQDLHAALTGLLTAREAIGSTIAAVDADMKQMADASKLCSRLMSVPGAGAITSLALAAAIEDQARFKKSRGAGAYPALVTRRYQSGRIDGTGSIKA
ncbi:MAG: transposase [Pseudomonadota bacterium]